jgi:hypothetical protein
MKGILAEVQSAFAREWMKENTGGKENFAARGRNQGIRSKRRGAPVHDTLAGRLTFSDKAKN